MNRLIHAEIDQVTKAFLLLTIQRLIMKGYGFVLKTPLPNTQFIKGIVGINTQQRKHFMCLQMITALRIMTSKLRT